MSTPRIRSRGFTLIEMMVALTVVAIAMGAILSGMARFASNAAHLRTRTIALWVAHNRLTELELQRNWPDVGKSDGDMEMADATWKWQLEVKKTEDPHLRRVDISITAPNGKSSGTQLSAFLADTGRQ